VAVAGAAVSASAEACGCSGGAAVGSFISPGTACSSTAVTPGELTEVGAEAPDEEKAAAKGEEKAEGGETAEGSAPETKG